MSVDLQALRKQYSKLETEELARLATSEDFLPEVTAVMTEELARREEGPVALRIQELHQYAKGQVQTGVDLPRL